MFQSTPPRGGRPSPGRRRSLPGRFNPRPRAGGDFFQLVDMVVHLSVSIHAPARGATIGGRTISPVHVFQSTPPRGGRRSRVVLCCIGRRFQSTPPRGGRRRQCRHLHQQRSFNPRPRAGGDKPQIRTPANIMSFNPRPRAGGDVPVRLPGPSV